jgi:serine/threonine-protein kinase
MPDTGAPEEAAPADPAALPVGTVVGDRYRIVGQLGAGGMGAVYVAEHVHMRKKLALKVLHAEMSSSPEVLARFEREAMAAAHIDHPNVAAATDFGRTPDGAFFLVLELVEGKSLRDIVEEGPLPEARALPITRQIASALARAHELGIVHRDLKPENVIVTQRDEGDFAKVLDFGIAKVRVEDLAGGPPSGQVLTQLGTVFGTPEYMAPEQAMGQPVDARADLYALGVMLYEMLSGVRPFADDNPVRLLMMHVSDAPPPLESHPAAAQTSPAVREVVMRLLAKKPEDRYASARELLAAIDATAASAATPEPVSVSQPRSDTMASSGPVAAAAPPSAAALARTELGLLPPSSPLQRAFGRAKALLDETRPKLPEPIRKLPPVAVLGGAAALVLLPLLLVFFVGLRALLHTSATSAASSATPAAPQAKAPVDNPLSEADIAQAKAQGASALEKLVAAKPKDPRVRRALVTAYADAGREREAMSALKDLLAIDKSASADKDMQAAVGKALAASPEDVDAALLLLEGPLGQDGVDILLDQTANRALAPATKKKIEQSLAKPEVRAHASPAATIVLDLRAAKTCEAKRDVVSRAAKDADDRALPALKALQKKGGCGFLGSRDCWPCLRKDGVLDEAVAAIEARSAK